MASFFDLELDTLGPSNPVLTFVDGLYTPVQIVNIDVLTDDPITTGYQMKIWGDVDLTFDANVQGTEGTSTWITYTALKQIKLSTGDALKTVSMKIRDDVYNESTIASDTITFDSTLPIVNIVAGPDVTKISKILSKNECNFSFQTAEIFVEYKVKVVPNSASLENAGTTIGTVNGSLNMSGTGTFPAATPINSKITGADLEITSAGDGVKVIKVFVKDLAGNWSV